MPAAEPRPEPAAVLALLRDAVRAAGAAAMEYYGNTPRVWQKHDETPVSEADHAADDALKSRLTAARPGYGWMSEESGYAAPTGPDARVWIVDPIDGTRAFLRGRPEWAVSAALVEGDLETAGDIEDFEFPPAAFLYAMAGLFRPGNPAPTGGFRSGELDVIEYADGGGTTRLFYFEAGRVVRVEERRGGRLERRIEVTWGGRADWPAEAQYRDDVTPSRVRWRLTETRTESEPFGDEIYAIPSGPGGS